jgi:pimeloyl-ACP methyl ester carboxylesterase
MLRSWWIQSGLPALESAETRLLALTGVKRYDVPVGNGLHIHTLEGGQSKHIEGKPPLILLHGYGQGAAAFFLNLPQLTENVSLLTYICVNTLQH